MLLRHNLKVIFLLGLLLVVAFQPVTVEALAVPQTVQQMDSARAIVGSSTVVLTPSGGCCGGNQPSDDGVTGTEVTTVPTSVSAGLQGVNVNKVVISKDLTNNDKYFEFTLQASSANAPFPAGNLRVRYVDNVGVERTADVTVLAAAAPTGGGRAGATVRLPALGSSWPVDVRVVFEEDLSVAADTATSTRVVMTVTSGLSNPGAD